MWNVKNLKHWFIHWFIQLEQDHPCQNEILYVLEVSTKAVVLHGTNCENILIRRMLFGSGSSWLEESKLKYLSFEGLKVTLFSRRSHTGESQSN